MVRLVSFPVKQAQVSKDKGGDDDDDDEAVILPQFDIVYARRLWFLGFLGFPIAHR